MSGPFDPYHVWLGIPPHEQPPDHYRLLGLARFEDNADVISNAADQRMTHLRTFQSGVNATHTQRLLNEVASARVCLLSPHRKAEYDAQLKAVASATAVETNKVPERPNSRIGSKPSVRPHEAEPTTDPDLAAMLALSAQSQQAPKHSARKTPASSPAVSHKKPTSKSKQQGFLVAGGGGAVVLLFVIGLVAMMGPGDSAPPRDQAAPPKTTKVAAKAPPISNDSGRVALIWPEEDRAGARLSIDGQPRALSQAAVEAETHLAFDLPAGEHQIAIHWFNGAQFEAPIVVARGEEHRVTVRKAIAPPTVAPPAPPSEQPPEDSPPAVVVDNNWESPLSLTLLQPLEQKSYASTFGKPAPDTLQVDGRSCVESLNAHAPSRLVYAVPAGAKYFAAVGVLHDEQGSIAFQVFVDDQAPPVFQQQLESGAMPIVVPLPEDTQRLVLVVDDLGSVRFDQSFWCYPRFYRERPTENWLAPPAAAPAPTDVAEPSKPPVKDKDQAFELLGEYRGLTRSVTSLAISPDDKQIYAIGADGRVYAWNRATGNVDRAILFDVDDGTPLGMTTSGKYLVRRPESDAEQMQLEVRNVTSSADRDRLDLPNYVGTELSPNGKILGLYDDKRGVAIFDLDDQKVVSQLGVTSRMRPLAVAIYAPRVYVFDAFVVAHASSGSQAIPLRSFDFRDTRMNTSYTLPHNWTPTGPMAVSRQGDIVALAGRNKERGEPTIQILSQKTKRSIKEIAGDSFGSRCFALLGDHPSRVAVGTAQGEVHVVAFSDQWQSHVAKISGQPITALAGSQDRNLLAVGDQSGKVRLYAVQLGFARQSAADGSDAAAPRTWTDVSGKFSIDATYVRQGEGSVQLRKSDGNLLALQIELLSETDRKWLQQQPAVAPGEPPQQTPPPLPAADLNEVAMDFSDLHGRIVLVPTLQIQDRTPLTLEAYVTPRRAPEDPSRDYQTIMGWSFAGKGSLKIGTAVGEWTMNSPGSWEIKKHGNTKVPIDQLIHVAGVYDGRQECRIYVDGRLVQTNTLKEIPRFSSDSSPPFTLGSQLYDSVIDGRRSQQYTFSFNGLIHQARVSDFERYRETFTPPRILADDERTMAAWMFDEGEGDVLHDSSGNKHHGKINEPNWIGKLSEPGEAP